MSGLLYPFPENGNIEPGFYLKELVHACVCNSKLPAKVVADRVQKKYSTLMREVNPYDESAKLGIDTCLELMRITGNIEPLEFMARHLGYKLVPINEE
jgi:hypothetical protein